MVKSCSCCVSSHLLHPVKYVQTLLVYFSGITYGYQLMDSGESPNVPFTIFRTRFSKGIPIFVGTIFLYVYQLHICFSDLLV